MPFNARDKGSGSLANAAVWLGGAGAVPFVLLCVLAVIPESPAWQGAARTALLAYAATILAFLGGIHWGIALMTASAEQHGPSQVRIVLSVMPQLTGAVALLAPPRYGSLLVAAGLVLLLTYELAAGRPPLPDWFVRLRVVLTVVAVVALLVSWTAARYA